MKAKFKRAAPQPQVHRVCAVCGKRHGPTFGFRQTLAYHGIAGDKTTIECVRGLALKKKERRR
jgi:hypothetical protein